MACRFRPPTAPAPARKRRRRDHISAQSEDSDDHGKDQVDLQIEANAKTRHLAFRMTSCFVWLARRAAFTPITQHDQWQAENNQFLITTPVRIDWNFFDERALNLNGQTHYDQFEQVVPPNFARRLLMMKRGRGVTQTRGYYIGEKIDELTKRLTEIIVDGITKKFRSGLKMMYLRGGGKQIEPVPIAQRKHQRKYQRKYQQKSNMSSSTEDYPLEPSSAWSHLDIFSIRTLCTQVTLEEPAYDDLLMLLSPAEWREEDASNKWRHWIFGQDNSCKPNYDLNISHFRKVPRSDLELILPADSLVVKLRPSLLVNYVLVGAGAFILTGSLVWHGMEISVAGAIASSGLVVYLTRAGFKYWMSKLYYKSSVSQYLSSNCIATNRASIHSILYEARQQDFRCISIVCCALWSEKETKNISIEKDEKDEKDETHDIAAESYYGGNIHTKSQCIGMDELIEKCRSLVDQYNMDKKVTVDMERVSNALHWLSMNDIVSYDEKNGTITPRSIEYVHRRRQEIISKACENHDHMWKSFGISM